MTGVFLLVAPVALAESRHPVEENGVRSEGASTEAAISFVNRSDKTIKVYWLDFSGQRVLYKTLKSKEEYTQQTFLTHPWLIADENDNAWYVYYADGQPRTVEIIDPNR